MDTTAVVLCRDNNMPLRVLDMTRPGALLKAVKGEPEGTLIGNQAQLKKSIPAEARVE